MFRKLAAVAAFAALSAAPALADTLDDVIDRGILRCGVVLDFPPIGFRDENNEPAGFDVQYCKDLANALGSRLSCCPPLGLNGCR